MEDRANCGTDLVEKKTGLKNILSEINKTRRKGLAISRASGNGAAELRRVHLVMKQKKSFRCCQIRFIRTGPKIKD